MSRYILRLDDASPRRNIENWDRMEKLLDKWGIKPLVGVIPNNQDDSFNIYKEDPDFWSKVKKWVDKNWTIALHGYNHVYVTSEKGVNPVNYRSEFAGLSLDVQREKIKSGIRIMNEKGIKPTVFFAPSHTFDNNTLLAIREESDIRVICDTIASNIYFENGFFFVPQQSGNVRYLPLSVVTFCYHPNIMQDIDFVILNNFLMKYKSEFCNFNELPLVKRKLNILDKLLKKLYFLRRRLR